MPDTYDTETATYSEDATPSVAAPSQSLVSERTLSVAKAQKIVQAYTDNPSWLADPRTAHAANAIFSAASKVVGMGIQMERVTNMGIATKNLNEFTKQKVDALAKVAAFVPEDDVTGQAELGRLNGMVSTMSTPDFNLQEFSTGVSMLQSKYKPKSKGGDMGGTPGWFDTKGNFHADPTALIEARTDASRSLITARDEAIKNHLQQRFDNALALIDPKNKAAIDRLREKHNLALDFFDYTNEVKQRNEEAKFGRDVSRDELKSLQSQFSDVDKKFNVAKAVYYSDKNNAAAQGAYNALFVQRQEKLDELNKAKRMFQPENAAPTNAPAAAAPTASAPSADELIDAVNPSGKKVRIRKSQADDARKSGYTIQ